MDTGSRESMKKSDKEKPLPKPPTSAFGRKERPDQEDQTTLLADRMAAAMAEGKLDEFLKQEMPDNEYARNLATMMMGMTGMMPAGGAAVSSHAARTGSNRSRWKTRLQVRHLQKKRYRGMLKKRYKAVM
jgi:hypothetical protein